jgi:multicomponent Na+:H+ antiporter subunit D
MGDEQVGKAYRGLGLLPLMLSSRLAGLFDNRVIDGMVDGLATLVRDIGGRLRVAQRGAVQESLALVFVLCVVLVVAFLFAY